MEGGGRDRCAGTSPKWCSAGFHKARIPREAEGSQRSEGSASGGQHPFRARAYPCRASFGRTCRRSGRTSTELVRRLIPSGIIARDECRGFVLPEANGVNGANWSRHLRLSGTTMLNSERYPPSIPRGEAPYLSHHLPINLPLSCQSEIFGARLTPPA